MSHRATGRASSFTGHPLAGVVRWVNERELHVKVRLLATDAPEPHGQEWVRADRAPQRVPELIELLRSAACQGHQVSAAAVLAANLGRYVFGFAAATAYLTGRAPGLSAPRVWLRFSPSGGIDELALRPAATAVLHSDPMAQFSGTVVVDDEAALDHWFIRSAVTTLTPILAAVRDYTRFGTRPQWSMAADSLYWALLLASDEVGRDQWAAWDRATRMVGYINCGKHRVTPRQRAFPLTLARRPPERPERLFLVRGGCCFYYKYAETMCASCPLSSDEDRERLLRGHFELSARS
ncbi:(2Fe-2S)-binding protein [Salinactinospora qingdaonensis]|uniref:FhuF 2Fe-2S C-terminal domain-containing protein n=1 Tax=Salinactinospora qingdaonensis TaxID=702744 RepID=A0ABP7GEW4_9ACTN